MKDICVLILAGGDSSRIWPLKDKLFINFFDRPLIYYSIAQLVKFGFVNFTIVVNKDNKSKFEKLEKVFSGISFSLVEQTNIQGMAGAVFSAEKFIQKKRLLIIGPSDIYEDILFTDFKRLIKVNPDGILAGVTVDKYFPGGYLTLDQDKVVKITEKPKENSAPSNIVNFVFHYIRNSELLFDALRKIRTNKDDHYEKALNYLLEKGADIRYLPYSGYWGYLKYPWHVLSITSFFLERIKGQKLENASIANSAVIEGKVFIGDNVKIMENVKIIGPTYIGYGTVIGQNCLIRESMIGSNCVVGYSTEIARSYIGNNCWFHHNYVGDSVLSNNVSMGAGAVTANFRFDEKPILSKVQNKMINTERIKLGAIIGSNVRIGINASLMPGIKIGEKSFVGPAVLLDKDLLEKKYCVCRKNIYRIKENEI